MHAADGQKKWFWLLLAIGFGGVLDPLVLMLGLIRTAAATASLLLNLEAALTALLVWIVFREDTDRRVVLDLPRVLTVTVPNGTGGDNYRRRAHSPTGKLVVFCLRPYGPAIFAVTGRWVYVVGLCVHFCRHAHVLIRWRLGDDCLVLGGGHIGQLFDEGH